VRSSWGFRLCETDDSRCTCGAPKDTPGGMHHAYCPANPESRIHDPECARMNPRARPVADCDCQRALRQRRTDA